MLRMSISTESPLVTKWLDEVEANGKNEVAGGGAVLRNAESSSKAVNVGDKTEEAAE